MKLNRGARAGIDVGGNSGVVNSSRGTESANASGNVSGAAAGSGSGEYDAGAGGSHLSDAGARRVEIATMV